MCAHSGLTREHVRYRGLTPGHERLSRVDSTLIQPIKAAAAVVGIVWLVGELEVVRVPTLTAVTTRLYADRYRNVRTSLCLPKIDVY